MKIITICNAKGGVGKTTTALNIASYISKNNKKVLILDIDPQANATNSFLRLGIGSLSEGVTLHNVLHTFITEKKKNILPDAIKEISENLYLIPSSLKLESYKDIIRANSRRPIEILRTLVEPIRNKYDYLIIDCPADLSIYNENAIELADYILCPSIYDFYGLDALALIIPFILDIKDEKFFNYKVIYTMFNPRATKIQDKLKEYGDMLEKMDKVLPFKIPVDQGIKNSQADLVNFMFDDRYVGSRARKVYEELGEFILENWR